MVITSQAGTTTPRTTARTAIVAGTRISRIIATSALRTISPGGAGPGGCLFDVADTHRPSAWTITTPARAYSQPQDGGADPHPVAYQRNASTDAAAHTRSEAEKCSDTAKRNHCPYVREGTQPVPKQETQPKPGDKSQYGGHSYRMPRERISL